MPRASTGGAGDYWGKVTLYRHSVVQDSQTGQKTDSYADAGNLWCYVVPTKAKQEPQYGALNHVVEAEIHLRGYPDVTEKDKFYDLYGGRYYQAKGIVYDFGLGETVVHAYAIASLQGD